MRKLGIKITEKYELYEVGSLTLIGNHSDRRFAPNIDHGGNVHLNILESGACAGNHYHMEVEEFFINPGPDRLLLHLKHPQRNTVEVVEMSPASLIEIKAYHPKVGIPHMIENKSNHRAAFIILVNKDNPEDVFPQNVYVN